MQAMVYTRYGAPADVLHVAEIDTPQPQADEVLIEIHASSVNYGDRALVRGKPFLVRFMGYGVRSPNYQIPGGDIAGRVAAVGANVTQWQPGDEVFADIGDCGLGAYAEYVAVPALTRKPANLDFAAAASVPQAAVVALQGLRDKGEIAPGDKVLINGVPWRRRPLCGADCQGLWRRRNRRVQHPQRGDGASTRRGSCHRLYARGLHPSAPRQT
ncbi:MAG: alcohol dehydrogenase catalytic domain-containing protein [Caldilineaceae bacterium]